LIEIGSASRSGAAAAIRIGKLPVNLQVQVFDNVVKPDDALTADWTRATHGRSGGSRFLLKETIMTEAAGADRRAGPSWSNGRGRNDRSIAAAEGVALDASLAVPPGVRR
jgi:hypothetical protein